MGNDYTSYAINAIGSRALYNNAGQEAKWPYFPPAGETAKQVSLASLEAPSTTVQALESNRFEYYSYDADFGADGVQPINSTSNPRTMGGAGYAGLAVERHLGTINVLWCDGHVKAVKLDLLATKGEKMGTSSDYAATYFTTKADPM